MFEVDVIIPVYKPAEKFIKLLEQLKKQSIPIQNIILINTEKKYFDELIDGTDFWKKYDNVQVKHISKEEFDHGKTRNYGVSLSKAPYFIMMTDDAVPVDEELVKELLKPFEDEEVGMSYARQLPGKDSDPIERFTRAFNYPDTPLEKSRKDLEHMGIKTFFASDVCAAYRRETFDRLGGFINHAIFNEDMIYARKLIDAGYKIFYAAGGGVEHFHSYNGRGQFKRNFDMGVSHADHPEVFSGLSTESEGIRLVKKNCVYLCKAGKPHLIIKLFWLSGCKYLGYFLGKRYKHLPEKWRKLFSMNKNYWDK